jgi:LysM repeat protein
MSGWSGALKENEDMEIKRLLRITMVLLVVVMLATSLSACRLPASSGPEGEDGEEVPVTAGTEGAVTGATATPGGTTGGDTSGGEGQPAAATATPEPAKPTKTPVTYVVATPGIPTSYTLKYGEFPFCIARRFNVNQYELLALNGLGVNSVTYVGMTLQIPQTGNHFDGQVWLIPHPDKYVIVAGDTLEKIACKYGDVSPDMIALQNNLVAPYTLSVDQKLVIP